LKFLHQRRDLAGEIAGPQRRDPPALGFELGPTSPITLAVGADLGNSVCGVGFRYQCAMTAMAVPEAAMDEHNTPVPRQYNVWSPWQVRTMETVTEAGSEQSLPHSEFRLRIPAPDRRHVPAAGGGRRFKRRTPATHRTLPR